jgi:hypothetical protein
MKEGRTTRKSSPNKDGEVPPSGLKKGMREKSMSGTAGSLKSSQRQTLSIRHEEAEYRMPRMDIGEV